MIDTIDMARDAGGRAQQNKNCDVEYLMSDDAIKVFAQLVRADEREACAKVCEDDAFVEQWKGLAEAVRRIRARGEHMTKDEALKLALEVMRNQGDIGVDEWIAAEAAIKQALAAPDLQAELDATNRQVEILSDALAESRRDVDALVALARADEREECAKMVEDLNEIGHSYGLENRIRARGNT
jgi:hypothetical protein